MASSPHPVPAAAEAFRVIQGDPEVEVVEPLYGVSDGEAGAAEFRCRLPVRPHPNPGALPPKAVMRVRMGAAFPLTAVSVYAEDAEFRGFPHQDAETGKLCLLEDHLAPYNEQRLGVYLKWTTDWLTAAATGQLLQTGDPYELPDFSRHKLPRELPTNLPVLFDESAASFDPWRNRTGQNGAVEFLVGRTLNGILPHVFRDRTGRVIKDWKFADGVTSRGRRFGTKSDVALDKRVAGRWILLPDIRVHRHRPAQTFAELSRLCRATGVDLDHQMRSAWELDNKDPRTAILLVGFPIPVRVGDPPNEVHWQPLLFENERNAVEEFKPKHGKLKRRALWAQVIRSGRFAANEPLPWGQATNIARARLYARGQVPVRVQEQRIVLAGCGALGAAVAESLARGGARDLSLFDGDSFELGNQSRHPLDGGDVGVNKAQAEAQRLLSCNPLANIRGYSARLPLSPDRTKQPEGAADAVGAGSLFIDCTTDEGAFLWLNRVSRERRARLVSMFLNFKADLLTLCVSGRHTSCRKVCRRLYDAVMAGNAPVSADEYWRTPEKSDFVIPGAGCWHPTFPASNAQIAMLGGAAVEVMLSILDKPAATDGTAVLIRRNEPGDGPRALVETVWVQAFR